MARVRWQLFCTFTFKGEKVPVSARATLFFSLVRETASNFGVHFSQLVWCLRLESGEASGRLHLHALIAGLPAYGISARTCLSMMSRWERLGGGIARVRVYDAALHGASYIVKGLEQTLLIGTADKVNGANLYEFGKFGQADKVTLSKSFHRVVLGRRRLAKRLHAGEGSNTRPWQDQSQETTQSGVSELLTTVPVETSAPKAMPEMAGDGVAAPQTDCGAWIKKGPMRFERA